jgi:UbiD family decarboxylase
VAGEAKDAIMAAFISDWHIKFVVAVDEDVNIFSDQEVLWAVATRTQPNKRFFVIPDAMGASLDPTVSFESSKPLTSKMGIDATPPMVSRSPMSANASRHARADAYRRVFVSRPHVHGC